MEKGVDDALAELFDKWQAEARSDDDAAEEREEGDEGTTTTKEPQQAAATVKASTNGTKKKPKRRSANQGKRQTRESESENKAIKRVRTTFDDEEGEDAFEWDIFEDEQQDQQPPTKEEEDQTGTEAGGEGCTAENETITGDPGEAPVKERRAIRVGGVRSNNEETGEQSRRGIRKNRKAALSKSSGRGQASKRWEPLRATLRGGKGKN